MRIGLDCTPLLGRRSGIGTYTLHLLEALVDRYPHDEFAATAFTWNGRRELAQAVPPGVTVASRPVPARLLRQAWQLTERPRIEDLAGRLDVFHATNFLMPPVGRAAGVVTIHDLAYLRFPETVSAATLAYRELVPKGLARVGAVVVPSRAVADQVLDAYAVDPASVVVTHEGVDPAWGATAPKTPDALRQWGIAEDFLVVVGTLEPRKNLPRLLAAYAAALRDDPDLPQLVIVGGQGWGDALDLTGVPDGQVVTPGHLPWADLRGVVASARALLFPSLDEGFGLPPLEALACGTPVLAADIPVLREVLGDQALFVPPLDVEAIAAGIADVTAAPVGTATTRRDWAARFTWRACAEATHTAYDLAVRRTR